MKAWIPDIAAYLVANQLLFYHVLSQKVRKYTPLPTVNLLMPDEDLIDKIREIFSNVARTMNYFRPRFAFDY